MYRRYDLNQFPPLLMRHFSPARAQENFNNKEVRPTDRALIIRINQGERLALLARWGLIPAWSKDEKIAQHTFNARHRLKPATAA